MQNDKIYLHNVNRNIESNMLRLPSSVYWTLAFNIQLGEVEVLKKMEKVSGSRILLDLFNSRLFKWTRCWRLPPKLNYLRRLSEMAFQDTMVVSSWYLGCMENFFERYLANLTSISGFCTSYILDSSCNMTFLFRSPLVAKTYYHEKLEVCHEQVKRLMSNRTLSEDFSVTDLASFDSP